MLASLNPFSRIIETKLFPFARLFRTSLWKKLKDTFYIFAGKYVARRKTHLGLIDYALFTLPFFSAQLAMWSINNFMKNPLAAILLIPNCALALPLNLITSSLAMTATLIVSPLVLFTHLATLHHGQHLKNAAKYLVVEEKIFGKSESTTKTLGKALAQHKLAIDKLDAHCFGNINEFTLEIKKKNYFLNFDQDYSYLPQAKDFNSVTKFSKENLDSNAVRAFKAFLQLNLGKLTTKLEAKKVCGSLLTYTINPNMEIIKDIALNTFDTRKLSV